MTEENGWTIGRLINWTAEYLGTHGADSPRLDAEVLLAEARGCQRIDLYTAFDELASNETRAAFRELVRRRAEGTPVAYLVGRREFYALSFRVNPDVLIPRPETEFVVITLLDIIKKSRSSSDGGGQPIRIADVGTGSGVLAICAARHVSGAMVTALDVSPAALAVARQNAGDHGLADRIEFVESDLFAALPADRRFDYIVSNPPYVSAAELESLSVDVRDHEPHVALLAGERGTEVIERLVPVAAERLLPGGSLIMEISPMIAAEVGQIIAAVGEFEPETIVKDLAGLPRVVQARRRGL